MLKNLFNANDPESNPIVKIKGLNQFNLFNNKVKPYHLWTECYHKGDLTANVVCDEVELCGEQEEVREEPHYLLSVATQDPGQASHHRSGNK